MNLLKTLGSVVKVAGPALVGLAAGGPSGAVMAVGGQLAGAGEKKRGQLGEEHGKPPVHKITAPVAAVAGSGAAALVLAAIGVHNPEQIGGMLCNAPTPEVAGLIALLSVAVHQIGRGLQKAQDRR